MNSITTYLYNLPSRPPLRSFKKGRPIFYQGEIPRAAYVVKQGVVRVYSISNSGEERLVTYFWEGDLLPVEWLFDKSPVSLFYCDAFSDCELWVLGRDEVKGFVAADAAFGRELLDKYITHYIGATIHINALEHSRAQEKLVSILQYLVLRFGKEVSPGNHLVNLRLTHQDVAGMVGLSRETAAIELSKLKKRGVIDYAGFRYTVNMPALLKIAGEDEFEKLSL